MSTAIKICGINSPDALDAVVRARVDYAGFVLFPPSPRHISPDVASHFVRQLPPGMSSVVLTVDADDALIEIVRDQIRPDFIQAHGKENPGRLAEIAARSGSKTIKALAIASREDLAAADPYSAVADMLMFDAKPPEGADRPGGHGQAFDWQILAGYKAPCPWLLAGGLEPGNVSEAIVTSGAQQVDVSSGVERQSGVKDAKLIASFVAGVRDPSHVARDRQSSLKRDRP